MNLKRIAASAASIIVLLGICGINRYDNKINSHILTAYADEYDFDYIDEYDYDDIDETELDDIASDEINVNADISDNENSKREHNVVFTFFVCLMIGLISALIAVSVMKSSMKSVHKKTGAADYRKKDSFRLEKNTDTFLYKRVEKTAIPKTNQPNKQ
ncbi:hypothetical protein [Ruminococcus flavefaciens]|uniref:hypothetical protein n=1 Tax=Ruminococcus flavefaciens TaxID=1265 RepID=UPI00048E3FB1|nr:hypothetical protein [Ruminococcus flavefaciens]